MHVSMADAEVVSLVRERGGRLYVWTEARRCCGGGMKYLSTGTEPARGREFRRVDVDGFALLFDAGRMGPPDELVLDVRGRRRKRVEAYWNGCVFAM
jgi:hypothetical protein